MNMHNYDIPITATALLIIKIYSATAMSVFILRKNIGANIDIRIAGHTNDVADGEGSTTRATAKMIRVDIANPHM